MFFLCTIKEEKNPRNVSVVTLALSEGRKLLSWAFANQSKFSYGFPSTSLLYEVQNPQDISFNEVTKVAQYVQMQVLFEDKSPLHEASKEFYKVQQIQFL